MLRRTWLRPLVILVGMLTPIPAEAHPGAGIVVDEQGKIFFVDTGAGVWKLDPDGRLEKHRGAAFHWMAIDRRGGLGVRDMPRDAGGDLPIVGPNPSLILSSDFPIAVGADGGLYYPKARGDRVEMMRAAPGRPHEVFAVLPPVLEADADGRSRAVPWIQGLAAGPDGSLYYCERDSVRKIAADGTISLVVGGIKVPDCERPPLVSEERLGPLLRGLDVAPDGTVYVAASGCKSLLKIAPDRTVSVVLRAEDSWSPTAVAIGGDQVYVLEYWHVRSERRESWIPRVRKLLPDGSIVTVATVSRP